MSHSYLPAILTLVKQNLEVAGFSVITAEDGVQGLAAYARQRWQSGNAAPHAATRSDDHGGKYSMGVAEKLYLSKPWI